MSNWPSRAALAGCSTVKSRTSWRPRAKGSSAGRQVAFGGGIGSPGFSAVKIRLDDKEQAAALALGTPATVAIYTDWGKPFAMISKVAVRMQKWLYFLPLPAKN